MTVGQHFAEYLDLIGADKSNPAFADVLAIATVIPAELETKAKTAGLMTEAQAKQNANVKKYFFHNALDPIDQDINAAFDEHGFDDAAREEFKKESSTYKKATMLRRKIAELESSKAGATGTDKDKLKDEIKKLNKQVLDTEDKYKKEIAQLKENEDSRMLDYANRSLLASRKYPGDKIPHDVNIQTAKYLLDKTLKEKGGKLVFADKDKTAIKLVSAESPDLDYTVNNKALSYEAFVEQTLADNGMTIVSNPKQNGNGNYHVDISKLSENDRAVAAQLTEHIGQM